MLILGIETSCDDTCAAIVSDQDTILSSVVWSQHAVHEAYRGVVPEIAAREHIRLIGPVLRTALDEADLGFGDLDGIAVTNRPGLIGSLLVGVSVAKGLRLALGIPVIPVNHLYAHLRTIPLTSTSVPFPYIILLVSGGHTMLFRVHEEGRACVLGSTRDDAAGEALDKAANLLGLGYPGGPAIDTTASAGDPHHIDFPRPMIKTSGFDFSFSGLKTALAVHLSSLDKKLSEQNVADITASYLEAVVDVLVEKTISAALQTGAVAVGLAGGVAANRRLRSKMADKCDENGLRVYVPPAELCTDNAAMVASLGRWLFEKDASKQDHIDASATCRIERCSDQERQADNDSFALTR